MKNVKKVAASFVAVLSVFATFAFAACEPTNNNGGGGNGGEGGNGGGDDNNTPTYTTIDAVLENLKGFNPTSATMDFDMEFEQNMVRENSEGSEETTANGLMEMEAKANYADGDMDLSYKVNTEYDDEEDPYHIEMESYARDYELFFTSYGAYPQGTPSSEMDFTYIGNIYGGEYFDYAMGETLDEFLPGDMTQEDIAPLAFGYEAYTVLKLAKDYQAITQDGNTFTVDANKLAYNLTSSAITILDSLSSTTTINMLIEEPTIKNLVDAVNYDLTIEEIYAIFELMVKSGANDQDAERVLGIAAEYLPEENVTLYNFIKNLASSEELAAELGYDGTLGELSVLQLLSDFDIDFNEYWPEIKAELQKTITATEIKSETSSISEYESLAQTVKYYDISFKYVADESGVLLGQEASMKYSIDMENDYNYGDGMHSMENSIEYDIKAILNYSSQKQTMADLSERYVEEYLGWEVVENGTTDKYSGYVYDKYDEESNEWNSAYGYYELTMVDGAISNVKIYEDDGETEITSAYNAETGLLTYTYNGEAMEVNVTKAEGETYAYIESDQFFFGMEIGKSNYEYTSIPDYIESLNSAE